MDFLSQAVGPQTDLETGKKIPDGGFDVTLTLTKLGDNALNNAAHGDQVGLAAVDLPLRQRLPGIGGGRALEPRAGLHASASTTTRPGSAQCGSDGEKCQLYPGDKELQGDGRPGRRARSR